MQRNWARGMGGLGGHSPWGRRRVGHYLVMKQEEQQQMGGLGLTLDSVS